jgi:hypothetical protein
VTVEPSLAGARIDALNRLRSAIVAAARGRTGRPAASRHGDDQPAGASG